MKRPIFKDFIPECNNPMIINDMFLENPELYNYIQSLDGYVDYLEDKLNPPAESKDKKAEEILAKVAGVPVIPEIMHKYATIKVYEALEAMEEYAKQFKPIERKPVCQKKKGDCVYQQDKFSEEQYCVGCDSFLPTESKEKCVHVFMANEGLINRCAKCGKLHIEYTSEK